MCLTPPLPVPRTLQRAEAKGRFLHPTPTLWDPAFLADCGRDGEGVLAGPEAPGAGREWAAENQLGWGSRAHVGGWGLGLT